MFLHPFPIVGNGQSFVLFFGEALPMGKKLYVGNLPYQAQSGDVEVIFVDAGFQMSVFEATIVT